jgi:hypothetical protein
VAAEALGAKAFAFGDDVAFADAEPDVETVAHEVTHVLQQRPGSQAGADPEEEADRVAAAASRGRAIPAISAGAAPALRLKEDPSLKREAKAEAPANQYVLRIARKEGGKVFVSGSVKLEVQKPAPLRGRVAVSGPTDVAAKWAALKPKLERQLGDKALSWGLTLFEAEGEWRPPRGVGC